MIFRDLNLYYCARAAVHVVMVCLFLVLNSYAATAKAADFASASACSKCHQEVYQKILTASFRHQRADRECALCHVATEPPRGIDIASTSYKNTVTLKAPETTKDNYRIVIKAKDEAMRESQPLSTLVDITSLAEEVYKGGSLQIFAVKVSEVSQGVSLAMQKFGISYTKAINKRFNRVGALFQGQFKGKPVKNYEHLLNLCIYIHANPVKDGLVALPENWEFSNYLEWTNLREGSLVDREFITENFGSPEEYKKLVMDYIKTRDLPDDVRKYLQELDD